MPTPSPTLVVFDLGGVLVRIARSWAEACAAAGVEPRAGDAEPLTAGERDPWIHAYETGRIGRDAFVRGLSEAMRGLHPPDEVARVHDAWLLGEYPGVASVFDALDAAGVPTAVLSNTNEAHWRTMFPPAGTASRFPTLARVGHPHGSHVLGARKPDARSFRAVERATGTSGPSVVFFDDLDDNVEGARRVGWTAHRVDPRGDPARQVLEALGLPGGLERGAVGMV